MGIFGSLGVGTKALSASQMAISVAGQNIANANTEGYSRKRVSVSMGRSEDGRFFVSLQVFLSAKSLSL